MTQKYVTLVELIVVDAQKLNTFSLVRVKISGPKSKNLNNFSNVCVKKKNYTVLKRKYEAEFPCQKKYYNFHELFSQKTYPRDIGTFNL